MKDACEFGARTANEVLFRSESSAIAQSEAPDAAPGVLADYGVEFVSDVRGAKATGATDVGRSNARGTFEGASAGRRGMVNNG